MSTNWGGQQTKTITNMLNNREKWHGKLQYRVSWKIDASKSSHRELQIKEILEAKKYGFIQEVEFKQLPGHIFDFYIPQRKVLIEYDGSQHFSADNPYDKGDESKFNLRKTKDQQKTAFAYRNGIKLLRINKLNFDKFEKLLNTKMYGK